jgi:PPOX class probable F420-dependent enzyme
MRHRRDIFSRLPAGAARLLRSARLAHLATADKQNRPHVVPICFVVDGNELFTPLDEKPKTAEALNLKRVRNILANPQVAVVVDHYDEDWRRLTYLLLHGKAHILHRGQRHKKAIALLRQKYSQYKKMNLEERPLVAVQCSAATPWAARAA